MKKLFVFLVVLFLLAMPDLGFSFVSGQSGGIKWVCSSLTGNVVGSLDRINGNKLYDGDMALVITTGQNGYLYVLDDDYGGVESSPDTILPDTNPGTKGWILINFYVKSIATSRSATPSLAFKDSNCTDSDDNVKIYVDATDEDSNEEDVDVYMQTQIDGTLTTFLYVDADGDIKLGTATMPVQIGVPTVAKSANYTVAGAYAYGGVIYVTSTCDITAPDDLAAGMAFTVITIGAIQVDVDVQADDKMYLDGVLLDDGDKAVNTSTTGDSIVCTYYSADGWYCMSGSPDGDNWTDGS